MGGSSPHPSRPEDFTLRKWRRMTAKAGSRQAQSLNAQELQDFCQIGLKLVSSGSSETRHQVLTTLATDEGLARVREVVEIDLCRFDHEVAMENFERIILSLLQTIAHREVLSSLVLETSRGTIYNVIFGIEGRRAVSFLRGILLLLKEAASRRASGDQVLVQSLSSVLTVFAQVIECNQMAYIVPDFQDFLYEFELLLDSSIGPIRSLVAQQANHQLLRIRKRLEKGATIDLLVDRKNDAPVLNSGFEVTTEGPGDLCSDGSRHDNDHEDICRIQIMPTVAEIRSNRSEYLPVTDPTKFHVTGMKGLLDRQFRLLREDTIGQLRDCVRCVLEEFSSPSYKPRAEKRTQHGTRYLVYQSVVLSDVVFEAKQNIGLQVIAEFDQPFTVRSMKSKVERQRWWSETKQLQVGSLLCLVDSAGRSLFLSVSRRDAISDISPSTTIDHNLSLHIGDQNNTLNPMATADSAIPEKRDLWNDQFRCAIMLQLVDLDTYGIGEIVGRSQSETHVKQVLVEFPGVLLPSFRPTLEALKEMSRDLDIPFASLLATQDELVAGTIHSISPPAYAFQPGFSFDLGSITGNIPMFLDPLKPFDIAHLVRHSTLDEAQCEALVNALRREFAVIQGPPGTGKSYVAVQLVRILLKQREETEIGPIICVCYTNHALDGCLEHILAQGTDKIIRLGAGSKSTILEPFNLRNIAMNTEDTKTGRHSAWQALTKVKESSKEVVSLLQNLKQSGSPRMVKGYLEGAYPYYLQQFLDTTDEEGFTFVRNERKDPLESWLAGGPNGSLIARTRPSHALNPCNLFDLGREERNILYSSWTKTIRESLTSELNVAIEANLEAKKRLRQCRSDLDLRCLEKSHIIGLTTSGLARHIDLLRRLNPKVLICEEAGEILEAHTLTAFLPTIEHAILIGDHEQLRPQVQNYDLSIENPRGQKYSLDVSLFERLVRQSGSKVTIPHSSLRIQRRMDPSISKLIKDTIYPRLEDHEAVATYPPVVGMRKRLFWLDHRIAEARCDTNQSLSTSHWNDWEIDMIAALVTHLVRQGVYKSEEIAVLTPYVRQLQRIRNVLKSTFDIVLDDRDEKELEIQEMVTADPKTDEITGTVINRDVGPKIQKITISQRLRIATVDNFQGEEAKVVLVSLVRSNEQRSCGFLRTTNRINVLLSRAKHGMYIIGNSETYSRIEMWAKVIEMLRGGQNLGPQLGLCCPRHPDTSIEVSVPDDFVALSPEGGCALQSAKWLAAILGVLRSVKSLVPLAQNYAQPDVSIEASANYHVQFRAIIYRVTRGVGYYSLVAIDVLLYVVLHALVDFVECRTYAEIDLNKDPIIIPTCGHIVTRSSLDGHMAMSTFYEMDAAGIIRQLAGTSNPFSVEDVKACPTCRAPLRDIHRYGRIVKRGLIDEATKRFIVWANSKFVPLEAELHDSEMALSSTKVLLSPKTNLVSKQRPPASGPWNVELSKSRTAQIEQITELPGLSGRYDRVLQVRSRIRKFSRQVSELEQPFGKVYQMVEDVRRTTGQVVEFPAEGNVLRVHFVKVYQDLRRTSSSHYSWTRGSLTMDLKTNRRECLDLADDAQVQDQPMQEIEARVYFARMVTLERALVATALEGIQDLVQQARTQLEIAQRLCSRSPNTKTMLVEVETVLRELRDSTFYTTVSNDEKRAVYKAMAIDFRGTGHWYYCRNGHLFTVGECGLPMQTSVCPQCGAAVGGENHRPVEGMTSAGELDREFGQMAMSD
ncbi:hypothetical protein MMC19_003824 [Ptychographa xylographoides]|nr:hypothetical protein [Ptychographa xylographoides]